MMKRYLGLVSLAMLFAGVSAQAQSETTSMSGFMDYPDDARTMAMGGASLAADANAFTIGVNPAGMVLSDDIMAIGVNYMSWSASNADYMGLSGFLNIGSRFAVSVNAKYNMLPKYNMVDDGGNFVGEYAPGNYSVGVGVAYRILDGFSVGANFKYAGSSLARQGSVQGYHHGSAFAADISLMYRYKGLNVAVAANNLGTEMSFGFKGVSLPAAAKLGVAYNWDMAEKHRLTASAEYDMYLYNTSSAAAVGLEYAFNDMVYVRGGYHYGADDTPFGSYVSVGAGVKVIGISLNAAYVLPGASSYLLQNTFNISLGYEF